MPSSYCPLPEELRVKIYIHYYNDHVLKELKWSILNIKNALGRGINRYLGYTEPWSEEYTWKYHRAETGAWAFVSGWRNSQETEQLTNSRAQVDRTAWVKYYDSKAWCYDRQLVRIKPGEHAVQF
jgi:hypothetical protein